MFKPLIVFRQKLLWSDDTRIRKIARAISETTDVADFKFFSALFCNHFIIDDLGLDLVRTIQRTGFIYIPAVSSDPLFWAFDIKFFETKVGRQKLIFVFESENDIQGNSSDSLQDDQLIRPAAG